MEVKKEVKGMRKELNGRKNLGYKFGVLRRKFIFSEENFKSFPVLQGNVVAFGGNCVRISEPVEVNLSLRGANDLNKLSVFLDSVPFSDITAFRFGNNVLQENSSVNNDCNESGDDIRNVIPEANREEGNIRHSKAQDSRNPIADKGYNEKKEKQKNSNIKSNHFFIKENKSQHFLQPLLQDWSSPYCALYLSHFTPSVDVFNNDTTEGVILFKNTIAFNYKGRRLILPLLNIQHWEVETEEGGFIDEEGYIYETPYGKVITQIIGDKEEVVSCQLNWEALKLPA